MMPNEPSHHARIPRYGLAKTGRRTRTAHIVVLRISIKLNVVRHKDKVKIQKAKVKVKNVKVYYFLLHTLTFDFCLLTHTIMTLLYGNGNYIMLKTFNFCRTKACMASFAGFMYL